LGALHDAADPLDEPTRLGPWADDTACHLPFADPYCDRLRGAVLATGPELVDGGTMVVIEGPRFSTRAESQHYAGQGWTMINMSGSPKRRSPASWACATPRSRSSPTWTPSPRPVAASARRRCSRCSAPTLERLTGLLTDTVARLPDPAGCTCATWADGVDLTDEVPGA
jgi:5'-methylthioadenosine phosphorylase